MSEREPMSENHDCGGDAAAYVLGALEPQEAESFRAHLLKCAVCRDEVEALGGAVQALPMAALQYEAPRELRQRVIRDIRREPSTMRPVGARPSTRFSGLGALRRRWAAGATAAVVATAAVTGIELSAGAAATVFQARVTGVSGSAQLRVTGERGELVVHHLTPPGHHRVYEIWLQSGAAAPVPASVLFPVNSSGNANVGIPERLHGVTAVMVTSEPAGGSPKPTHAPVIVARLD